MPWKKIGWGILIIDILVINILAGYAIYKNKSLNVSNTTSYPPANLGGGNVGGDICGSACQSAINERINQLKIDLASAAGPSAEPKVSLAPTAKPAIKNLTSIKTKTQTVTYVTIPGSGTSSNSDWSDLTGTEFYFNAADYPGLIAVYFEANCKLFNGNGTAYVRLYDAVHGIGVQGSDVQTNNQANDIVTSGRVSFWAGNNLIKVQAKTLTADTAVFNSGRLKIIQEN